MAAEIVMPRLSDSMEEGTILTWMKALGDEVQRGDELVEIETDKANMVYEADSSGTLVEILAAEGATLPIGETIARLGDPGDELVTETAIPAAAAPDGAAGTLEGGAPDAGAVPVPPVSTSAGESSTSEPATAGRIKASPIARRIAGEAGIDLAGLTGSGPGGRIVKADVEGGQATGVPSPEAPAIAEPAPNAGPRALAPAGEAPAPTPAATAPTPPPAAPASTAAPAGDAAPAKPGASERPETAKGQTAVVELTKLQQTVARRMAESKATAPHFYLTTTVDMTRSVDARAQLKASAGETDVVPSFNDLVVKACAIALREFPRANGAYRDGAIELYSRVNVGVAVAGQDALVVPTVFDADLKGLRQIAADTRALAARVRDGSITPPELSGGTFTVSNLGMYGITSFAAVINPPQAGILAVGEISERPVANDGEVSTAQLMDVSIACDHRILYGADGAAFLARIRALLEEPLGLAL